MPGKTGDGFCGGDAGEIMLCFLEKCDLCGRNFIDEEEFFLLWRLRRLKNSGTCEILGEQAFCVRECGGVKTVRL
jgi:hypothetical protein